MIQSIIGFFFFFFFFVLVRSDSDSDLIRLHERRICACGHFIYRAVCHYHIITTVSTSSRIFKISNMIMMSVYDITINGKKSNSHYDV